MIKCGQAYTIIEIGDEELIRYANPGFEKLAVGDQILFEYEHYVDERYPDRPWPVAYLIFRLESDGTGRKVGRSPKRNISRVFAHDALSECAYRIATEQEAKAVFAGVPVDDVLI